MKLKPLVAAVCCAFLSQPANATLASFLPTKDGIVVTADKLVNFGNGVTAEDYNKISPFGKRALVVSTGNIQQTIGNLRFDVNCELVTDSLTFLQRNPSILPFMEEIKQNLAQHYLQFLSHTDDPKIWSRFNEKNGIAFTSLILNYNTQSGQYEGIQLAAVVLPNTKQVQVTCGALNKENFDFSRLTALGGNPVYGKIENRQPPFDGIANEPWCQEFIFLKPPASNTEQNEAISATTSMQELVHKEYPNLVGTLEDVAVLSPTGVEWKFENAQPSDIKRALTQQCSWTWIQGLLIVTALFGAIGLGYWVLQKLKVKK